MQKIYSHMIENPIYNSVWTTKMKSNLRLVNDRQIDTEPIVTQSHNRSVQ